MLHHIIVKWNANVDKEAAAQKVHLLYAGAAKIPGIQQMEIRENIIPRDNRYDIMIVLNMEESALSAWDQSELHRQWKAQFGPLMEKKCIFDCESPTI